MPKKVKSAFDINSGKELSLTALHTTEPSEREVILDEGDSRATRAEKREWKAPRSPTRTTRLRELAAWLGFPDGPSLKAAAGRGEVRLKQITPRQYNGCMMDVARLNPSCLEDAAPE